MSDSVVTPWIEASQAPLSMGFPRQEHWSGLPFSPPGDIPDSGIEPMSLAWQVDSLPLSHQESKKEHKYPIFLKLHQPVNLKKDHN